MRDVAGRLIVGAFGVYTLWVVWRGWRDGEAWSRYGPIRFTRRPIAFVLTIGAQIAFALLLLAGAAGYFSVGPRR